MALSVNEILALYEARGRNMYGSEQVSQTEHALQCAAAAMQSGASSELIAASLLHDIGHLMADRAHRNDSKVDDVHQFLALPFLRGTFPDAVLEPIRLHVDAKRYLCHVEKGYWSRLSEASKHSLELQGGRFSAIGAERFISRAWAWDAVRLRRWDDLAKKPGAATPLLRDFEPVLCSLALSHKKPAAAIPAV